MKSLKERIHIDIGQKIAGLKTFDFMDDRCIKTFLGVNVERTRIGYYLSQEHLISIILEAVSLKPNEQAGRNTKDTPVVKHLLIKDTNGEA